MVRTYKWSNIISSSEYSWKIYRLLTIRKEEWSLDHGGSQPAFCCYVSPKCRRGLTNDISKDTLRAVEYSRYSL
jgi:hypothetical protein